MEEKQFNIVYTVDDDGDQLLMLQMSIETLLKYNKVDNLYIVYVAGAKCDLNKIKASLFKYKDIITYYPFDTTTIDSFFPEVPNATNQRLRYSSLMRWFLGRLPLDDFWYIDTDVLFADNVRSCFIDLQEDKMFVAFNRKLYSSEFYKSGNGDVYNTSDINAGIMYMNIKRFNDLLLFEDVLLFYNYHSELIKYVNLTAYEYLFDKYRNLCKTIISKEYNIKIWDKSRYKEILPKIKIHHFSGEKKQMFYRVFNDIMKNKHIIKKD